MGVAEVEQGVGNTALLPDFCPKLVAGLETGHDQVQSDNGDSIARSVLKVEASGEKRVSYPDAFPEIVLDLQSGSRGDFLFRSPGSDSGMAGQKGKGRKADENDGQSGNHGELRMDPYLSSLIAHGPEERWESEAWRRIRTGSALDCSGNSDGTSLSGA